MFLKGIHHAVVRSSGRGLDVVALTWFIQSETLLICFLATSSLCRNSRLSLHLAFLVLRRANLEAVKTWAHNMVVCEAVSRPILVARGLDVNVAPKYPKVGVPFAPVVCECIQTRADVASKAHLFW